jgi:hypothetical protein
MGCWNGSTFKEYIREELHVLSQGMSRDMKQHFRFVNISGGAYHDLTDTVVAMKYTVNSVVAQAAYPRGLHPSHIPSPGPLMMTPYLSPRASQLSLTLMLDGS